MEKLDITSLMRNIAIIDQFDILGLAEKELGDSLLERCRNIVRIREKMNSNRIEKPIHIFGCLDPLSIVSYFLCGADIFDGLSWLKYTFHENVAVYMNNHALLKGGWSDTDLRIKAVSYMLNLKELMHLQVRMAHFIRTHNLEVLNLSKETSEQIKSLSEAAGIDF